MVTWVLVVAVAALTAHTLVNARLLRRPRAAASTVDESVAVLLPLRDEAARVEPCLRALKAQEGVPGLEVIALDDGSTDGTADLVRAHGLRVEDGTAPPPGWLGKPHACHQLAARAPHATVLVFVDADVVLAPHAVAAAVCELRAAGVDLLSPYPRIVAGTAGERLVQPLLQWSWLTFLPLRAMERSPRPSLAAAGGQFLVVDRAGYDRAGGHAGVRDEVLEDVALARAVKRTGGGSRSPTGRGWPPAACTARGASSCPATRSRCGRRSARRWARPPSWCCSCCCTPPRFFWSRSMWRPVCAGTPSGSWVVWWRRGRPGVGPGRTRWPTRFR
ncbi:hypothetical protein Phou_017780 [Phytohabitans houttuyneae]|uniref:Glycosyltransferase 2-like domain-containing protein n=1 Tax=Phytohabitans houttuyneae TaxID=1076126 RepID=A0A6V8K5M2_9ACTN|nr:hypothetical protein Phou_017780 [Phytohabitans houttuyneae]